jgi:hypothetical protein
MDPNKVLRCKGKRGGTKLYKAKAVLKPGAVQAGDV